MSNRKIQGYPSFVYEYLNRNTRYDQMVAWVKNSDLLIADFGAYRAVIHCDMMILLQDVKTGVIADLRNIYNVLEAPSTADYIFKFFLKVVKHTDVITVYFDGNHHYYYAKEGE